MNLHHKSSSSYILKFFITKVLVLHLIKGNLFSHLKQITVSNMLNLQLRFLRGFLLTTINLIIYLSTEVTFHITEKVNSCNIRTYIWENTQDFVEVKRERDKISAFKSLCIKRFLAHIFTKIYLSEYLLR